MTYGPPPSSAPGPEQSWGAPPPSATPYQPPATETAKVPAVAWLVPGAAVLAVIGAATPWFKPEGTAKANGRTAHQTFDALYSWKDGKIGLLAPILLVVLAVAVVGLLTGRTPARFSRGSSGPVVSAARGAIIAGAISLVCVVIAWFLIKSQYKFDLGDGNSVSWDDAISRAKAEGVDLSIARGPQIGLWLTGAAALLAIVAGVLMLVMRKTAGDAADGPAVPLSPPPGYGAVPPAYGTTPPPPAHGTPPPAAPGYQPPPAAPGYQPPAPGYQPPPTPPQT